MEGWFRWLTDAKVTSLQQWLLRFLWCQEEDDEYYYYVKAVPKITISAKDKQVKEIHSPSGKHRDGQRARRQQEHSQARRRPRQAQGSAEYR